MLVPPIGCAWCTLYRLDAQHIRRHTNSCPSDVITYAATIKLLVTSGDLSQWRCHYCEPADSKMAEIQLTVEVKCCAGDKCVPTPLSRTYTVYVHTHTYTQVLLSPNLFFLMSCWVASPAQKSHSLSLFPLLIQGDKVTPVTSKNAAKFLAMAGEFAICVWQTSSQYSVISKSYSVLQIQIAVAGDWRWLVNVEICRIFLPCRKVSVYYALLHQLYSRHHTTQASLCQVTPTLHGLYMLCWIEMDQWPIQMCSVSLLYLLGPHLHNKCGVRLRHWKLMAVWLSIKLHEFQITVTRYQWFCITI